MVKQTREKYGIDDEDIDNFDETEFAMGLTKPAKSSLDQLKMVGDNSFSLGIVSGSLQSSALAYLDGL